MNSMKVMLVANTSWFLYNFCSNLIFDLQKLKVEIISVAPHDEWTSRLREVGTKFIDLPMNRKGLNPFVDLRLLFRLHRIYYHEKPDIVFHNTIKPVIYGSIAAHHSNVKTNVNMISGLGYVFTGNGIIHKLLRPIVCTLYRYALNKSTKVLFLNTDDQEYFIANRLVKKDKVIITYGAGVDTSRFYYSEPQNNDSCIFIYIGRILGDKGVNEYINAAKIIKSHNYKARFQLVGKYDEGNPTCLKKELIEKYVSERFIEYVGNVDDVRPIIVNSDVVVLPSYREGIPRSILEGMSMGKPVITTDVPGCRETVVHNENGLLVPVRNIETLVKAMEFMILNPKRRIEMGKKGRELVLKKFDVKQVNEIILNSMNLS